MKKNDALNELYSLLIEEFIKRIKDGTATPGDLNAARQFLRDQHFEAVDPQTDEGLTRLSERMKEALNEQTPALH